MQNYLMEIVVATILFLCGTRGFSSHNFVIKGKQTSRREKTRDLKLGIKE